MNLTKTLVSVATGAALLVTAAPAFAQTTGTTGSTGSTLTSPSTSGSSGTTGTMSSSTSSSGTTGSSTYGTTGSSATTPGTPNTGAGGDAATNWAILGTTAAIALAGSAYLATRKRSQSHL